jgi:hypothetical protein
MVEYKEKSTVEEQTPFESGKRTSATESASLEEERERLLAAGKSTAMEQKTILARNMTRVARALQRTARNLDEQEEKTTARYFDLAADRIDRFSENLEKKDLETLLADSQNFARRHPVVVFSGAMAAGLIFSRVMKSSATRRRSPAGVSGQKTGFQPETRVESMGLGETEKRQSRPYGAVEPGDYASQT